MAYWKIPFISLGGDQYEVRIGGAAQDTTLTGGARPFITEEDDDEDFFMPVRLQHGMIRIVDNGTDANGNTFDWRDLIPATATSRPVTLHKKVGANLWHLMWTGYLKPETYSGKYLQNPQERAFPVVCPLTVLEGEDVVTTGPTIANFAYILQYIFGNSAYQFYFWFQGASGDVVQWLKKGVAWRNFFEYDEDTNQNVTKYNCLELLTEVCRFWGWQLRQNGDSLYFTAVDDGISTNGFVGFDYNDLISLSNGGTPQPVFDDFESVTMGQSWFVDTDNNIELMQGIHEVTITADTNKVNLIGEFPADDIQDSLPFAIPQDITYGTNGHHLIYSDIVNEYTFDNGSVRVILPANTALPGERGHIITDQYYGDNLRKLHNYDFRTSYVEARRVLPSVFDTNFQLRMETTAPFAFQAGGKLVISATIEQVAIVDGVKHVYSGKGKLYGRLSIDDRFWCASPAAYNEWYRDGELFYFAQDGTPYFVMNTGNEEQDYDYGPGPITPSAPSSEATGEIICNRVLNSTDGSYTGYGIPLTKNMQGVIRLDIIAMEVAPATSGLPVIYGDVYIKNLKIEHVTPKTTEKTKDDKKNKYTRTNNSQFVDEKNISTIFATDNNNGYGFGIIMEPDGWYCQKVNYDDGQGIVQQRPEVRLAERIINYYDHPVKMIRTNGDVRNIGIISPISKITDVKNDIYYPVKIGHDWRDDITNLILMEI